MADFASLHFWGDALAWYCLLPPDIQEDWPKLRTALAERWSKSGGDNRSRPPNAPAAAAAPPGGVNDKKDHLERGILKASIAGKEETLYIWMRPEDNVCFITHNADKALRRLSSVKQDKRPLSCLAAHCYKNTGAESRARSTNYARLTAVDCDSLKSSAGFAGPFQLATFKIASTGEVTPLWRDGNTETSLSVFTGGNSLDLAFDREAFPMAYSGEQPV
ncbi:hypothetical protein FS837_006511, partial [Tulasnella sp. UAMH 9824]